MKKRLVLVVAVLLVLGLLASCTVSAPAPAPAPEGSGGGGEAAAPAGDVVVKFLTWRGEDSTTFNNLVTMFEDQNPGIKINIEYTGEDITEFYTVLKTRITSGEGADAFNVHPGPYINEYIDAGYCLDLGPTGIVDLYEDDYLMFGQKDGKQYGVLTTYNSICVYYNKAIFKDLGIDVPTNYAEFKAACDKVAAAGYLTMATGAGESWVFGMVYEPFLGMYSPDDYLTIQNLETGVTQLTDEPYVSVFNDIDKYFKDGIFQKDAIGTGYDASISLFATEKAAMLLSGTWSIGGIREMDPELDFGIFVMPAVNADPIAPILPGQLLSVNAKSKVVDAAVKWIEFLSKPEGAEYYATNTAQSPTTKGVVCDSPDIAMVVELMSGRTGDWPDNYMLDARTLEVLDGVSGNISRGMSVAEALAKGQAELDDMIVPNYR